MSIGDWTSGWLINRPHSKRWSISMTWPSYHVNRTTRTDRNAPSDLYLKCATRLSITVAVWWTAIAGPILRFAYAQPDPVLNYNRALAACSEVHRAAKKLTIPRVSTRKPSQISHDWIAYQNNNITSFQHIQPAKFGKRCLPNSDLFNLTTLLNVYVSHV